MTDRSKKPPAFAREGAVAFDLAIVLAFACACALASGTAWAQQDVNPLHPSFTPLDASGQPTTRPEAVSAARTCGGCHDAAAIVASSRHAPPRSDATCLDCHVDRGRLPGAPEHLDAAGALTREGLRIGKPRPESCARCHGLVGASGAAVVVPRGFAASFETGRHTWSLTVGEGAVLSPTRMADSFLNLEGKEALTAPWDVHAAKLVDCTGCHFSPNNPARPEAFVSPLAYVRSDPRRLDTATYLLRADHHLTKLGCRSCHEARASHDFLPYRARHLEVLACTACHAPASRGPVAELVDATVVTQAGGPLVVWRNVERRPGETLNAALLRPHRPLLVLRDDPSDRARRLTPVNLLSRFEWISGPSQEPVSPELLARAWLDGPRVAPALLRALDADGDGALDDAERRLDTPAKAELVAERLRGLGVTAPVIRGTLEVKPLTHGLPGRALAVRACAECHAAGGRLGGEATVASYLPGGVSPAPATAGDVELAGTIAPDGSGGLVFRRVDRSAAGDLYVLGRSRHASTNALGFGLFSATSLALALHAATRLALARRRRAASAAASAAAPPPATLARRHVFGLYERVWHWTMAGSGVVLMGTGGVIHSAGQGPLALATAVTWHNGAALVLMLNAFLALFYHVVTAALRNFIPAKDGLARRILEHVQYQSWDIFFGRPHPREAPHHRLNPLQQLTYLALLNVLFPVQMATGLLMWAVGHWPELGARLGGLSVLAPVHNLGAWLFMSFFVLHVYLVTTGRTLGEHLMAMVSGYRLEEPESGTSQGER